MSPAVGVRSPDYRLLVDLANAEFEGDGFNGRSLMATLDSLSAAQAADSHTLEGYSAWSVALHLAWCKFVVASALEEPGIAPSPYPFGVGTEGFAEPETVDEASWAQVRTSLRSFHRQLVTGIVSRGADRAEAPLARWNLSVGKAVVWICSHDTYHLAQIRNMGVPGLFRKRVY